MSTLLGPMFHWSPRPRRRQIDRYGLVPGRRNVAGPVWQPPRPKDLDPDEPWPSEFRQRGICCSPDPATAWAYSHGAWCSVGAFDLWQFWLVSADEVHILPMWGDRIVEVRVMNRIRKARLLWVGERTVVPKAGGL